MRVVTVVLAVTLIMQGSGPASVVETPSVPPHRAIVGASPPAARRDEPLTFGRVLARVRDQVVASGSATATSLITVLVPNSGTELFIQDQPHTTSGTGTKREFRTPPLERGRPYTYSVIARFSPNNYTVITRRGTVQLIAGHDVIVDLTVDDSGDRAEIRYVSTPNEVVARMVRLAGVTTDDVVYEPGCGDARLTIAAVKAGARRGVGIDIDPERAAESKANVSAAGLDDRIDVRLGDALDIKDLSEATVVFLYMGDEFNMLIRPILWRHLRVGARVLSHRFTMGDWKPDITAVVGGDEYTGDDSEEYLVHLWTITEDVKKRLRAERVRR